MRKTLLSAWGEVKGCTGAHSGTIVDPISPEGVKTATMRRRRWPSMPLEGFSLYTLTLSTGAVWDPSEGPSAPMGECTSVSSMLLSKCKVWLHTGSAHSGMSSVWWKCVPRSSALVNAASRNCADPSGCSNAVTPTATLLSSLVSGAGRTAERTVTSRSCCFAMASTPARRALALALESSTRAPPRNSADSNLSTQIFCRGIQGTGMVQPLTFRPASEHVRRTRRVPERPRLGPGSEVVARDAEACLPAGSGWRGCRRRRHLD
jgi:hypothetical protein